MRFKRNMHIITWGFLGGIIVCLFLFINLPRIVESQIKKRLPRYIDLPEIDFHIQRLGVFNSVVSAIHVGKGLSIDSITIDYDIQNFSTLKMNRVTVSGLIIRAGLDENNQIKIKGFELLKPSKDAPGPQDASFLSFLPEKIVLKNAKLILSAVNDEFLIPFDVLSTIRSKDGKIDAQTLLYPFGEKVNIFTRYDINKGIESLKIEGKAFDLEHVEPLIAKKINGVHFKGPVDFYVESTSPQKKWEIDVSRINLIHPAEANIQSLSSILYIKNQKFSVGGTFEINSPFLPVIPMEYAATIDLKKDHQFDLTLKNSSTQHYKIEYESMVADMLDPVLNATFQGTPQKSKGQVTLSLKKGRIHHQNDSLAFSKVIIKSDIVADFADQGQTLASKFRLTANKVNIKSDMVDSTFPLADVSGWIGIDKSNTPSAGMLIKAKNGKLSSSRFKTSASGISIEIPVRYPYTENKIYGSYAVSQISYDNQHDFSTKGLILQTGTKKINITGEGGIKTLPQLKPQFNSIIDFDKGVYASLNFQTNPFKLTFSDIEKLSPSKLQTADVDMTVFAKGTAELLNHQLSTSMQVRISDGNIQVPEMSFTATGINTTVKFNDFIKLESIPGQILTIDAIELNKTKLKNAKVRFSVEDARSLLIENMRFNWCNGLVSTESIRIPQQNKTYSLTLYCDRLELTQLLKQMGAFHAQGTGTLNGRIPVSYSDGNIFFNNGFLFSTPGSGGKVVVENTDRITAGVPMDSPQFSQLDLAREALKDFNYKWVKLVFNTFEDGLVLNMELDGKPSNILPFEFKKEFGGFVRVDSSSRGSDFEGIKLDVNLKLPFNEVMKFGNQIKSMFN